MSGSSQLSEFRGRRSLLYTNSCIQIPTMYSYIVFLYTNVQWFHTVYQAMFSTFDIKEKNQFSDSGWLLENLSLKLPHWDINLAFWNMNMPLLWWVILALSVTHWRKRECMLKIYRHQVGLWVCLWGIFLTPLVVKRGPSPLWAALSLCKSGLYK